MKIKLTPPLNFYAIVIAMLACFSGFSQNSQDYYVVVKPNYSLEPLQRTTNTDNSDNYILNTQQSSTSIDISTYTSGLYNIILICDGEVQNSKTLIKQ